MQGADAAEQLREALEIAGVFELTPAHDRRKAEHLGAIRTFVRNRALQPLHDALIDGGAGVDAVDAHGSKQVVEQAAHIGAAVAGWIDRDVHGASRVRRNGVSIMLARQIRSGTPPSREAAATLARMRLLLIITELDKTSRSDRPMENSLSLR